MPDRFNHTKDLCVRRLYRGLIRTAQTKCLDGVLVTLESADDAFDLCDFEFHRMCSYPRNTFSMEIPRRPATDTASSSCISAFIAALTVLCGFDEPIDFVSTSFTPANSRIARTPPAALTPVPGVAGRISTF